jgi:3-carboxy-cis,cis-muconate cycloisomerase
LGLKHSFSWQAQRDNLAEWASVLGILCGSLGKIAKDVSLLMQTEIGELMESAGEGKGGSSTMPHKRNPVSCAAILANTSRVPHLVGNMLAIIPQENERSAGLWHAEWDLLRDTMLLTAGSLEKSIELLAGLEVNEKRMLTNIDLTQGLIFAENLALALSPTMGKVAAHEMVEKACKKALAYKKHLKTIVEEEALAVENIDAIFDPQNAIGNSVEIVEEILKSFSKAT